MPAGCLSQQKFLEGRNVTSTPGIRDDMENAGATWIDEAVVVDGNIISSRRPPDLPPYGESIRRSSSRRIGLHSYGSSLSFSSALPEKLTVPDEFQHSSGI